MKPLEPKKRLELEKKLTATKRLGSMNGLGRMSWHLRLISHYRRRMLESSTGLLSSKPRFNALVSAASSCFL